MRKWLLSSRDAVSSLASPLVSGWAEAAVKTAKRILQDCIHTARENYKIDAQWRQTLIRSELQMERQNGVALGQRGSH